ncbi:hypothetical protein DAKH74_034640 [Maudiozyma humilis]|uniref:WKF domain-containing protein n=1 Tax=Maudiozyma humilis TaxID=51915 RepID=A0AAV5S1S6_MAUHU|nr:hypothetical protein DAKH74_034640 [Kazachstania humilis]
MENGHIPAWKRIAIKKQSTENAGSSDDFSTEDPLNVTTHLSTGTLSKKEKKRIINKDLDVGRTKNKISKNKKDKKKQKLPREERMQKKQLVLKDQLRYLLDFYKNKVSKDIPENVMKLESVKVNYAEDEPVETDENMVVEVWKFAKSKQNWLIKHFFSIDEIPIEYDDILVVYLKDLKGKVKEELKEKCMAQLKAWNNYMIAEQEKIKAMVENDAPKADEDKEEEDDSQKEEKKEEKEEEKKDEVVPPRKDIVHRSQKLLLKWAELEDSDIKKDDLELINFTA